MTPLDVIQKAVHDQRDVLIRAHDRVQFFGRPLHVGPRSVWLIVSGADVFIPLGEILSAELIPLTPEGTP